MEKKKKRGAPLGSKNALGNKGGARPTLYDPKYNSIVKRFCMLGLTDKLLAEALNVSPETIKEWKRKHPAFAQAMSDGKLHADSFVTESLYKNCLGYTHIEEKIFQHRGKIVRAKTTKHYPPDTAAIKFWLTNRQKDTWKDKQDLTADQLNLNVTIE